MVARQKAAEAVKSTSLLLSSCRRPRCWTTLRAQGPGRASRAARGPLEIQLYLQLFFLHPSLETPQAPSLQRASPQAVPPLWPPPLPPSLPLPLPVPPLLQPPPPPSSLLPPLLRLPAAPSRAPRVGACQWRASTRRRTSAEAGTRGAAAATSARRHLPSSRHLPTSPRRRHPPPSVRRRLAPRVRRHRAGRVAARMPRAKTPPASRLRYARWSST